MDPALVAQTGMDLLVVFFTEYNFVVDRDLDRVAFKVLYLCHVGGKGSHLTLVCSTITMQRQRF